MALITPSRVRLDRDHATEREFSKLNEDLAPNIGVSTGPLANGKTTLAGERMF